MSFFSDLFEGNFGNLGNDITHAPSSLVNHPDELVETGAAALAALTLGASLPETAGLFGAAGAADLGAGAADLGAADAAFGAFDAGAFAAGTADVAAGGAGVDALAAGAGVGADVGVDALAMGGELGSDVLPGAAELTTGSLDLGGAGGSSTLPALSDAGLEYPGYSPGQDNLASQAVSGTTADAGGGGGGGGFTQTLKDTLNSPYTRLAAGVAPLGIALAMGGGGLPSQLGPAQANAAALASGGSALNPSQQASLTQMRQNAVNAARQALFNQGVKNPESDTRYSQMLTNIDSQVTAAAQTMIQQNIQNSLAGDAQLIQIAQLQMTSDQNFANMLMNATKAFGTSIGLGGGQTFKLSPA